MPSLAPWLITPEVQEQMKFTEREDLEIESFKKNLINSKRG